MKKAVNINKGLLSMLATVCISMQLAACGGGDFVADEQSATAEAQMQQVSAPSQQSAANTATVHSQSTYVPAPSSSDELKNGFNPSIWNSHDWYECNCGRQPDAPASSTPWSFSSN